MTESLTEKYRKSKKISKSLLKYHLKNKGVSTKKKEKSNG